MAKLLKLRRGTTTQHGSFTGAEGEVTVDTDKETLVVHDGLTAGGHPVAAEDMANVSSASIAGRLANDSIATTKIAGGALPTDVTVASANIVDGTIVNADVNASAAIAGTKISPDFGSQNVTTTGTFNGSYATLNAVNPTLTFADSDNNPDFSINVNSGILRITDTTNSATRFQVNSNGTAVVNGNLDVGAGIDVTGEIIGDKLTLEDDGSNSPILNVKTDDNSPWGIRLGNDTYSTNDNYGMMAYLSDQGEGNFHIRGDGAYKDMHFTQSDGTDNRIVIKMEADDQSAELYQGGSKRFETDSAGVTVTGNIAVTGTVDGVNVAVRDTLFGNLTTNNGVLKNGVTATTQSAGDSSTKVATTAYTDTAISNLVDSSPSALNTLNELAAALNDDANFSSTVNTNIAAKLPKTGGTMSGDIGFGDNNKIKMGASHDLQIYNDGSDSFIQNTTNDDLIIHQQGNASIQIKPQNSYPVELYHNASKKAETTSGGFTVSGTCTATAFAGDGSALTGIVSFVSGMILLWSGSTGNIPSGWVLCNGSNSTPDLRDRFVIGAGNSYSVGATGGSTTDTVNITVSGTTAGPGGAQSWGGYPPQNQLATSTHTHTFSGSGSDTVSTMSPYYALCYIMKT